VRTDSLRLEEPGVLGHYASFALGTGHTKRIKEFIFRSYHPAPYASAEVFYESQYGKWSSTNLYAGCLLPVGKHVEFDPYYEHENNTGKHPNQQVNAAGLILNLYF
jgi:hypothetical protein